MSFKNGLGRELTYLGILAAILGCREATKPPVDFNNPRLESRLETPSSNIKVEEARGDIEKILASDYMKWLKKDSGLTFDYMTPVRDSKDLYLFRYSYGDETIISYYCQKNRNGFKRYAREIRFEISAEPYFVEVSFFGSDGEGVNPDETMRALMRRYYIDTKDGKPPKDELNVEPKSKLI